MVVSTSLGIGCADINASRSPPCGPARTLILLHGLGTGPAGWAPQARAFADERTVFVPRLEPSWRDSADAVVGLLDVHEGADVCGISLGALVALAAALERPAATRRLVLIAGFARLPARWRLLQALVAGWARSVPERRLRRGLVSAVPAPYRADAERELTLPRRELASAMREAARFDVAERAATLTVPTLVLCGERDRVNLRLSSRLARLLPDARFATVPDAGHVANLDNPEAVTGYLRAFLADDERASA